MQKGNSVAPGSVAKRSFYIYECSQMSKYQKVVKNKGRPKYCIAYQCTWHTIISVCQVLLELLIKRAKYVFLMEPIGLLI